MSVSTLAPVMPERRRTNMRCGRVMTGSTQAPLERLARYLDGLVRSRSRRAPPSFRRLALRRFPADGLCFGLRAPCEWPRSRGRGPDAIAPCVFDSRVRRTAFSYYGPFSGRVRLDLRARTAPSAGCAPQSPGPCTSSPSRARLRDRSAKARALGPAVLARPARFAGSTVPPPGSGCVTFGDFIRP
jgi:hypothetical protein